MRLHTAILILTVWTMTLTGQTAVQSRPDIVFQSGHSEAVRAVVLSPDGSWAATGSSDETIKIWNVESGRELRSLVGHTGAVKALAVSADGRRLASGGNDAVLRIWNVETGAEDRAVPGHSGSINAIAWNGPRIASAGFDGKIRIFDSETGAPINTLDHAAVVKALAFSSDGRFLASGGADKIVRIWNLATGKKTRELTGHTDEISALRFSEIDTQLASGSLDKSIRLWKPLTSDKSTLLTGPVEQPLAFKFLASDTLVAADSKGRIITWNTTSKSIIQSVQDSVDRDSLGEAGAAAFTSDGSTVLFGNGAATASVVNSKTGTRSSLLENNTTGLYDIAFSPDRRLMTAASKDNTIKLWDLQTGQSMTPLQGHRGQVTAVVFPDADGARMISSSLDSTIKVWDLATFTEIRTLRGHGIAEVKSIAVGSGGKLFVSGSTDKNIAVWDDFEAGAEPRLLKDHTAEVISVAISRDEKMIASGSLDGTIKLWAVSGGPPIRTIEPNAGQVASVAFSPDGKSVVAGCEKGLAIWDVATGTNVRPLAGHSGQIYSVTFSADGKRVVSAGRDKTVRLWNAADGREIKASTGHTGTIFKTTFLPDQRWFASAGEDGQIIVWDAENGSTLARLISLKQSEDWLVVTPEGFFDGSELSRRQISWRFENNTFNVRPVEEFFNEFWLPGLLSELLSGQKLPAGVDISKKNREQPVLQISLPDAKSGEIISNRNLKVRIDISKAPAGAMDVRLFRNGVLARVRRGGVAEKSFVEWTIPIVAGENRLTAYAFNTDGIKSKDERLVVTGAQNLAQKGVMHIVTIGVNEHSDKAYNLTYAVSDAERFAAEFKRQQEVLKTYERVEVTPLINSNATEGNIQKELVRLAAKAQPEDAVVVFFAGHGVREEERFYLITHDVSDRSSRLRDSKAAFQGTLNRAVSDEELERGFENIDAGQFLLVIDACNSGQVLESTEKRRGPMNSKGLAQLAYEKGIYILTAAQGFQLAKETSKLGYGYLTYALVEEGLKEPTAADRVKDGNLVLREWLDYAAARVPQIDRLAIEKTRDLKRVEDQVAASPPQGPQQPRVFYRREAETRPLIVALTRQ